MRVERPAGVTAVAAAFFLSGAYLLLVGLLMLVRPGAVSMAAGAALLGGLELAGPYMFLLAAGVGVTVALGLWWLHRWARWLAILHRHNRCGDAPPQRFQRHVGFSHRPAGLERAGNDPAGDNCLVSLSGAGWECIRRWIVGS